MTEPIAFCAAEVRRDDHDRFLTALFAPAANRGDLFALYAFNLEVAKTRERVSEAILGEIRLQWWREALDGIAAGQPRPHPVVQALDQTIARHGLSRELFDRLIDARAFDLDDGPPATLAVLETYAEETSSTVMRLALEVLGARTEVADLAARHAGIGWALVGLLRARKFHGAQGRVYLPQDLLAAEGLNGSEAAAERDPQAVRNVCKQVGTAAAWHLTEARKWRRRVPKAALPALLPARLAYLYLDRLRRSGFAPSPTGYAIAVPRRQLALLLSSIRGRY